MRCWLETMLQTRPKKERKKPLHKDSCLADRSSPAYTRCAILNYAASSSSCCSVSEIQIRSHCLSTKMRLSHLWLLWGAWALCSLGRHALSAHCGQALCKDIETRKAQKQCPLSLDGSTVFWGHQIWYELDSTCQQCRQRQRRTARAKHEDRGLRAKGLCRRDSAQILWPGWASSPWAVTHFFS